MHMSLCPDKPIMAGFLESFAPCPISTLAGHYDDKSVIYLRQRVVNVMQSGWRVVSQLRDGFCVVVTRASSPNPSEEASRGCWELRCSVAVAAVATLDGGP